MRGFKGTKLWEQSFPYFNCTEFSVENYEDLEVTNFEQEVFPVEYCEDLEVPNFVSEDFHTFIAMWLSWWILLGFRCNKLCERSFL